MSNWFITVGCDPPTHLLYSTPKKIQWMVIDQANADDDDDKCNGVCQKAVPSSYVETHWPFRWGRLRVDCGIVEDSGWMITSWLNVFLSSIDSCQCWRAKTWNTGWSGSIRLGAGKLHRNTFWTFPEQCPLLTLTIWWTWLPGFCVCKDI